MDDSSSHSLPSNPTYINSLQQLKALQKDLESQQKYSEAEEIEQKIHRLKEKNRAKEVQKLRSKQRDERLSIDSIFKSELKNFNSKWEEILDNSLEKFKIQQEQLSKRHHKLLEDEKDKIEKSAPCFFKPSAQLLNVIKCKEKAVAAKKYNEAQKMADEIDEALEFEKKMYVEQRQNKISKHLSIFQKKLDKEMEVLQIKQQTELRELQKIRDAERENMEKKVENISRELENAQNIQVNIAKGLHTTTAGKHSPQRPGSSYRSEHSTPQKLLPRKGSAKKAAFS